jgi:hypothetical protein
MFEPIDRPAASRAYATLCWVLCGAYAVPVVGRAVQSWNPQPYLPELDAFRGLLPPWVSMPAEALAVAAMSAAAWRLQRGQMTPNLRLGRLLAAVGVAYLTVTSARIAYGLATPEAVLWFRMWIPALMHVALAGFVLTVGLFHLREEDPVW